MYDSDTLLSVYFYTLVKKVSFVFVANSNKCLMFVFYNIVDMPVRKFRSTCIAVLQLLRHILLNNQKLCMQKEY